LISAARIDARDLILTELRLPAADERQLARWIPALGAIAAMAPFLVCFAEFRKLFWFGDEWDQLKEVQRIGVWHYLVATFAENFVPVFKGMWLFLIVAGRGSYLTLLAALWATHALNVLLLGTALRRMGVHAAGIAVALVWVGLPASNIETLGWTVQWSPVLSLTFFLLAVLQFIRIVEQQGRAGTSFWLLAAASLGSSLSFSRGVLSGCAIALTCAVPIGIRTLPVRRRVLAAVAALLPALMTGIIIASSVQAAQQRVLRPALAGKALEFAAHFFLLNPLQAMWDLRPGNSLLVLLGGIKLAIVGIALLAARGASRWLVWLSLVLDASNALLVGIGRFHTGVGAAVASRYQYAPLFCLAPPVAIVVQALFGALRRVRYLGRAAAFAAPLVLAWFAWFVASPWRDQMRSWSGWRGTEVRLLLQTKHDATLMPYVAGVSTAEANALREEFHLH